MAVCNTIIYDQSPSCDALKKPGGLRRDYYMVRRADITYTRAVSGALASITVLATKFAVKGSGRKGRNSGSASLTRNDNGTVFFNHGVKVSIPAITQAERNAAEALVGPDDIVVFAPTNAGTIMIYGLDLGMEVSKLDENTGAKLGDGSDIEVEISGEQANLPILFEPTAATTFAARIVVLEGLLNPSPASPLPPVG